MKVLLSSFHLKCAHFRISSTDSKVRTTTYVQRDKQYHWKVLLSSLHLNGHTRISSIDSKLRTIVYSVINSSTGKYCSVAFN